MKMHQVRLINSAPIKPLVDHSLSSKTVDYEGRVVYIHDGVDAPQPPAYITVQFYHDLSI